ncbi:Pkinase-domain-containing protein [Atractiella rhizophila]|nr:Pkinase-domain-containing protein [Atractiella rhizophila]
MAVPEPVEPANQTPPSSAVQLQDEAPKSSKKPAQLGEWVLGKTLGAGSMGKVKLAFGPTGEAVAIKIIPRYPITRKLESKQAKSEEPLTITPSQLDKAVQKDASNEVRTIREASILLLLHHPYICGMKSLLVYPDTYAFVLEYVSGGQMLDYIISHGRLTERKARGFARQIMSAIEYCHGNNIVHRDLKIENILISKTGNIRLTDFGLSNLFSPMAKLSTFCGSVYFAAPELLSAKIYTGPEVDVWSFGVVLYVLVCGRVPFEDESMPALHAKIKAGKAHLPDYLTTECRDLLAKIFVIDPFKRATVYEIINHPWLNKGFDGPPDSYLPIREPLQISELDPDVIKRMAGFDFGSEEEITDKLLDVLRSEDYAAAVRNWDANRKRNAKSDESLNSASGMQRCSSTLSASRNPSKRFSVDFKRMTTFFKHDGKSAEPEPKPDAFPLLLPASKPDTWDPTKGFHPLVSIYYLVREKRERESVHGGGKLASSSISLLSNVPPYPPIYPPTPHLNDKHLPVPPTPTSPKKGDLAPPASPVARRRSLNAPSAPRSPPPTLGRVHNAEGTTIGRATSLRETEFRRHKQRNSVGGPVQFIGGQTAPGGGNTGVRRVTSRGSALPQVDEHGPAPVDHRRQGTHGTWSRHGRAVSVGGATFSSDARDTRRRHTSLETNQRPEVLGLEARSPIPEEMVAQPKSPAPPLSPSRTPSAKVVTKAKPVYLKGLFSVATTTTKSATKIKQDLIQVLNRLGVESVEIPSGFECTHAPSIKLSEVSEKNDPKEMILRFEITIVKVPWLIAINGVQFRRISGDLWQYHSIARRILQEVNL